MEDGCSGCMRVRWKFRQWMRARVSVDAGVLESLVGGFVLTFRCMRVRWKFRQWMQFPGDHRLQRQFTLLGGELAAIGPLADFHGELEALVDVRGDVFDHFSKRRHVNNL